MANLKYARGVSRIVKRPGWFKANHPSELKSVHLLFVLIFSGLWVMFPTYVCLTFAFISVIWVGRGAPKRKLNGKTPQESGENGEHFVVAVLDGLLDQRYHIARNVLVPNKKSMTGTTEIDVLVIGPKQVWCIEVKNNKGLIEVDPQEARWKVNTGHSSYHMRDPSRQVFSQKLALESYIKEKGITSKVGVLVIYPHPEAIPTKDRGFKGIPVLRTPSQIVGIMNQVTGEKRYNKRQVLAKLKPILKGR